MSEPGPDRLALSGCRVLDLTDETGVFCTKVLAAMGADVIKVEPPEGDLMRRIGPFYHDEPDREKSLHWLTYNLNKRSVTLNLECATGQELFKNLVKTADFLVECFSPGYMDRLGLGYASLSALNPRLIYTAITPFGSTGPYSRFKGSSLVSAAMAGYLQLCGDSDRAPVQISAPVGNVETGLQAAAASLVADYYRDQTGEGQYIDVSGQEVLMDQIMPFSLVWNSHGIIPQRARPGAMVPGRAGGRGPTVFQCKDGFVVASTTIDTGRKTMRDWLNSEGMAGDLYEKEWDPIFEDGMPVSHDRKRRVDELFQAFALKHTCDDLMWQAQKMGVQVAKIHTVRDVVENPHSKHTGYFVTVEHPELADSITFAGSPFKSEEMEWTYRRRAPMMGEHNREIYQGELGLTKEEMAVLKETRVI